MTPDCEHNPGPAVPSRSGSMRIMGLTRVLAGILFFAMLQHPVEMCRASVSAPYSLTLAWNPSASPDVAGYRAYYGTASGNYANNVTVGNVTTITISGLLTGVTYYFALTAFDADGLESGFSNEVSYLRGLPGAQMQIQAGFGGQFALTVTGPAGHTYQIEATQDFTLWSVIGTGTLDASGALSFTDTNTANFPQRFYRTLDTQP